jgi:hypothetical protein
MTLNHAVTLLETVEAGNYRLTAYVVLSLLCPNTIAVTADRLPRVNGLNLSSVGRVLRRYR